MNWPEDFDVIELIIREHLDDKRANLQMLIVWDGEAVREWAPWEGL